MILIRQAQGSRGSRVNLSPNEWIVFLGEKRLNYVLFSLGVFLFALGVGMQALTSSNFNLSLMPVVAILLSVCLVL